MKSIILITLLIASAYCFEAYWGKGDQLLSQLQNGENKIFIVSFENPTPIKDDYSRPSVNNKVKDELQAEVLNKYHEKPLKLRYATINTTDKANANLLYKVGVHDYQLTNGPVVLVARKGHGKMAWGPTVIHKVDEYVQKEQAAAKAEQEAAKKKEAAAKK